MNNPVLQLSWNREGTMIFAGCGDNLIKAWDLNQNKVINIGQRTMAVAQVHWCDTMNVLYAMSWDRSISIWDGKQQNPAMVSTLDVKPHYMSVAFPMMVVATANRRIYAFDLNRLRQGSFQAITNVESLLKYNTKSIGAYQNGWVLGSIEGRCEIRVMDNANPTYSLSSKGSNFTFKAHREKEIYPVNCISFNPQFGTFITGGGDGRLYIWDKDSKMKLKGFSDSKTFSSFKTYPSTTILPVVDAAFNTQGNIMAVAYGYDWSRGVNEYEDLKNEVLVHQVYFPSSI